MRLLLLVGALALGPVGCTHMALERKTLNQVGTVSELRYKQVMNNLAVTASEPSSIPFYSLLSGGGTTVTDSGKFGGAVEWTREALGFSSGSISPEASRDVTETWTLDPVYEPEKLRAMRCAYQWVLCGAQNLSPDCVKDLTDFKVYDRLCHTPTGWLHVGTRRDVPKSACYVASWKGQYVWVDDGGAAALSQFTMIIQDIATFDLDALAPEPAATITKVTEKYEYNDPKHPTNITGVTKTTEILSADGTAVPVTATARPAASPRINLRGSPSQYRPLLNMLQQPRR